MTKSMCESKQFSFQFFKEKIKKVHNKLDLGNFSEDYIIAAKLSVEVARKVNEFNEKSMAKDGLVGQAWMILMMICSSDKELCANDLCEALGQSKATISRIIEALKEKSLIEETESKNDRRKYYLNITSHGIVYIKNKMVEHKKFYTNVFEGVNTNVLIPEMLNVLNKMNSYQGNNNE